MAVTAVTAVAEMVEMVEEAMAAVEMAAAVIQLQAVLKIKSFSS